MSTLTLAPNRSDCDQSKQIGELLMSSKELQAALEAAQAAAAVIQQLYRRNLAVTLKADKSPVTEADVRAEETIQRILRTRFPDYGFYGEEGGRHAMHAESIWLVDPLDGTKSFVREAPFFSTQIALMRAGELILGVSCASVYGEMAWAERGGGAFLDGQPIHTSGISELSAAFISTGNISALAASSGAVTISRTSSCTLSTKYLTSSLSDPPRPGAAPAA